MKILVTGGAGFIGSHLVESLVKDGHSVRVADSLINGSLNNLSNVLEDIEFCKVDLLKPYSCEEVCEGMDAVYHLAARVGGIEYNSTHHGTMFHDNVILNTNVLEACRKEKVKRTLVISSACVYSRCCSVPTNENEGFLDDPEPSNFGYGWAKRIVEVQARCYKKEFGMKIAVARPYNCYGLRDHFEEDKSHVIPALIKKVLNDDKVIVWGSGEQSRAFLYVSDFVDGIKLLMDRKTDSEPVNIGTDEEISIKDLLKLIMETIGSHKEVVFDTTKPEGQPRRNCDNSLAKSLGFLPKVGIKRGIEKTIKWYIN